MSPAERDELLRTARLYEGSGQIDESARIFAAAGSLDEAARVLSGARKFKEAAELLMNSLRVTPETVKNLAPEHRKYAFHAAICFGRAQEIELAVKIFIALKENQRAAELLERSGDRVGAARLMASVTPRAGGPSSLNRQVIGGQPATLASAQKLEQLGKLEVAIEVYAQLKKFADAGRLCSQLGRTVDAAAFYAEAGKAFEAGRAFAELGEVSKAVEQWVRVPRLDPSYRPAAVEVIRFAKSLDTLDIQIEVFLGKFIEGGPRDARELEAFYMLGKLYERHDLLENAKEVLRLILAVSPNYRDVKTWLPKLERDTGGDSTDFQRIVSQDESFRLASRSGAEMATLPPLPSLGATTTLPGLPDLPPLRPSAPSLSPRPASITAGGTAKDDDWQSGTQRSIPTAGLSTTATQPIVMTPGDQVQMFAGRYRVVKQIGKGGMGVVFQVEDTELNEQLALKLFTSADDDPAALARFRQELKLSRQLVHPNIVRLYDIGVDQGRRFITMELLSGRDLHAFMGRPMNFGRGINYLMQACAGLFAAHAQGVVHRDIKPENLFITDRGVLKVMDFGIAKGQVKSGATMEGVTAGTPRYMSPEQINSFGQVTAATDLYALGVVAYEMFTGRGPFESEQLVHILMGHLKEAPPPPRQFNGAIPEALEAVILKCLAKDPTQRFASTRDLAMALDPLRRQFEAMPTGTP